MKKGKEEYTVLLEGKPWIYLLSRNSRTRINIRVSMDGGIHVSAPDHVPVSRIEQVLLKRERWILGHIRKNDSIRAVAWNTIFVRGEECTFRITGKQSSRTIVNCRTRTITVPSDPADSPELRTKIIRALKREARSWITERTEAISDAVNIPYSGISIRDQRTRWGSSSGRGSINLNWRIIMAPDSVIDYLIIHELVHQVHHNHSKRFWKAVGDIMPSYRTADLWLKDNSFLLGLFRLEDR